MAKITLNIIHLNPDLFSEPEKKKALIDRRKSFENEMEFQGIVDYKVWDAVYNDKMPFVGCCQSHKQIVRDARERGLNQVIIAEDDIRFTSFGAWQYFLDCIPESFDFYMGVSYNLNNYPNGIVNGIFDSTTLYCISESFYDDFLAINEFDHLDRQLSRMVDKKEFRICQPYVVFQDSGYSFISKKNVNHDWRLKDKPLF